MNAPSPALTSSTSRLAPDGDLLGHHAGRDQRQAVQWSRSCRGARRGGRRPARGRRSGRSTATPTRSTCSRISATDSDVRKPGIDSSLSSVPPVCPEPAAAHLGHPAAAGGDQRRHHQRRLVAHAAGGVLVQRPATASSAARPRRSSRPAAPRSHASVMPRQTTAIRNAASCSSLTAGDSRKRSSSRSSSPPSRLRSDQRRPPAGQTTGTPGSSGSRSPATCWSTVAPTSANVSPSCRRPIDGRPTMCASSRPCSREWSVDGVVGSQPWSEVRISRSPCCSADSSRGSSSSNSRQAVGEPLRVVAVPPDHVGLDQVDEDEAAVGQLAQPLDRAGDALHVRLGRRRAVQPPAGEDVADLADAVRCRRRRRGAGRDSSGWAGRARSRGAWAFAGSHRARPRTAGRSPCRPRARPCSCPRAMRQAAYSSSTGTTSSCAAIWNTLSADV